MRATTAAFAAARARDVLALQVQACRCVSVSGVVVVVLLLIVVVVVVVVAAADGGARVFACYCESR